ncbi:F-box domain-containing protein [Caenorhabditis elegans]|uniref:F-box domain-containing protein n=1 Tax=Caenorhabditis elegans TaxID=6239 RepID=O18085_CAEEL|nr:F-box domain-containing protein [Caenorhabditis elegans]CAB07669.2 F-box domain-containing protein [Caenorhabditis elegans]|eukprot:NP_507106.2 F-box A protein [Caenorhabditis elegans]
MSNNQKHPTLLNMPLEVANQILEKLEPIYQLTSRKVCKCLKTSVDKLGTHFYSITFHILSREAHIQLNGTEIKYIDAPNASTYVIYNEQKKIIQGENFINLAFNDLQLLLKNPISKFEFLEDKSIQDNGLRLLDVMKQNGRVHLKSIKFSHCSIDDVLPIFPYLNAQVVEEIELYFFKSADGFDRIRDLDQWKNAKSFTYYSLVPMENNQTMHMFHFEHFTLTLDKFLLQDAIQIRDNVLNRSTFEICNINFRASNATPSEIAKVFKSDYTDDDGDFLWTNDCKTWLICSHHEFFSCSET